MVVTDGTDFSALLFFHSSRSDLNAFIEATAMRLRLPAPASVIAEATIQQQ